MSEQTTPVPVVAVNKPGCISQITTALVALLALSALAILALTLLGINPWGVTAARLAPTVQTRPTDAPRATSLPVQPAQSSGEQQVQAPPVAQPAAPAPVVPTAYVPPAEPIVQPAPDAWYAGTIKDYADRDPCSYPRANPQTCAGDVPEIPWPNGRNP